MTNDRAMRAREMLAELLLALYARPDITRLFGPHEKGIYERAREVVNERALALSEREGEKAAIIDWLRDPKQRSVPTMDQHWSAAYNACLDHVAKSIESGRHLDSLSPGDPS